MQKIIRQRALLRILQLAIRKYPRAGINFQGKRLDIERAQPAYTGAISHTRMADFHNP